MMNFRIFIIILYSIFSFAPLSYGLVSIDVNKGNVDPIPIALLNFTTSNREDLRIANDLQKVVENDLENSGLFRIIESASYLEQPSFHQTPTFSNWRHINSAIVVNGMVQDLKDGSIRVQFKIWDPHAETMVDGMSYKVNKKSWRRIAHKISDLIYKNTMGEKGYFDSRIVYISEAFRVNKNKKREKIKKLAIMDSDGANVHFLTSGKDLVLTPRFDMKSQKITYLSYRNGIPQVYVFDLQTGTQQLIGNFPGMSFAPRFSPNGQSLIMSVARNGTTGIYEIDLSNYKMRKIISDPGSISTSPSYSPDGKKIVFNSDRSGSRQIYTMNLDDGNSSIERISKNEGIYATPVWSPRGDFIAFSKIYKGKFYIGVMRPDGTGERLLTTSWLEEAPTWSPNGRVIMFYRQSPGGDSRLYAVDITGYHERLVPTTTMASDPAWSPLLAN